jgi:hypothetical protein
MEIYPQMVAFRLLILGTEKILKTMKTESVSN